MRSIRLEHLNDFDEWRGVARALLLSGTSPDECSWSAITSSDGLFDTHDEISGVTARAVGTVPPRFIQLAEAAICHSDPERFTLLYRLLCRLQKDKALLEAHSDPDVGKLERRASAVRARQLPGAQGSRGRADRHPGHRARGTPPLPHPSTLPHRSLTAG